MMHTSTKTFVAIALACAGTTALAQGYPTKLMRMVVPFPPSGPVDITARMLAPKFQESSGQSVIVDNRVGGATLIGQEAVVRAPKDGHTLLLMPTQIAINPALLKMSFDVLTDLAPVTQLTNQPYILVAHPSAPFNTVKELIAVAKAKAGGVRCASSGVGGGNHLACELFNKMAGTQITHIPYKGAAPALIDTISGQVEIYMPNPITAFQHVKSGKLRALAFTGLKRVSVLPDIPTIAETVPGFDAGVFIGIHTTGGTPREVVQSIYRETSRFLKMPDIVKNLTSQGGEIVGSTPEQFDTFMRAEVAKWAEVVKFSGAKVD